MARDWWLIIHTPDGPWCWAIGDPGDDERERLVAAGRVLAGFPADETWADDDSPWNVQLTLGQPHHTLIARAHEAHDAAGVGTVTNLRAVKAELVDAHQAAREEWHKARYVDAVALALAGLDEESLAAVLAHPALAQYDMSRGDR